MIIKEATILELSPVEEAARVLAEAAVASEEGYTVENLQEMVAAQVAALEKPDEATGA